MIYTCTIEVKEGDHADKLEKMARAAHDESMWVRKRTRADIIAETDSSKKCGSCRHFCSMKNGMTTSYGTCDKGRAWGARTRPACSLYEEA